MEHSMEPDETAGRHITRRAPSYPPDIRTLVLNQREPTMQHQTRPIRPTWFPPEQMAQPPPLRHPNTRHTTRSSSLSRLSKADRNPPDRNRHSSRQRGQNERGTECTSTQQNAGPTVKRAVFQPDYRSAPSFPVTKQSKPWGREDCSGFVGQVIETLNSSLEDLCVFDDHENKASGEGSSIIRSKMKRKCQHGIQEPSTDDVFNFMVKNMEGKGTPRDIKEQSGLFPAEIDLNEWFYKNKALFTLIERNGHTMTVLVYKKHVTYCFDYNRKDSCNKTECRRYHVCKNMVTGKCKFGRKNCKFSHDFLDKNNIKISDELGFSDLFSSDQICSILRASFPHVCTTWASCGSCDDNDCIRLHLCPLYMLGNCRNHPDCPKSHDRKSDHNKPILDAFEMSEMMYNVFRNRVFINNTTVRREMGVTRKDNNTKVTNSNSVKEDTGAAENTFICQLNLVEKCVHDCKKVHSSIGLPYIWQINLFGTWVTLQNSEDIEKAYSKNRDKSERITMVYNGMNLICRLCFDQTIRARVRIESAGKEAFETEARRLSTVSYKQLDDTSSDTTTRQQSETKDGFFTQWRWYWKDDDIMWHLFEPDAMQHILEAKFLANQKTYIFSRYNYYFNYTISFTPMCQSNNDTGRVRDISRRPVFVTGEDVTAKLLPQSLPDIAQVETTLPPSWMPWDVGQPFELVDIAKNYPTEIDKVMTPFFESIDYRKMKVHAVYRIQNNKLWDFFCSQERTMEAKRSVRYGKCPVDKRYLFHETDSEDAVRGICSNNFDPRVSGKTGILYGDGAYFARDAKYSHAYTKDPERYIFMVNVLVGQYTKGDKSYRRPPNKPGSDHELYDSCVNDIKDPSVFVVFDRNQYYPEYLIKYHDVEIKTKT